MHICTRLEVEGKCALLREDNIADIKKKQCDNLASNLMFF